MRRIAKLSLLGLIAGSVSACKPDLVVPTEVLPYAGVRFINAVPDSSGAFGLDLRFVDRIESNHHFRVAFRNGPSAAQPFISSQIQFKGAREGNRQFRIFLDDTLQSIAKTVVKDTSVALTKLKNYTAMLWGKGRSCTATACPPPSSVADVMRLNFWEEADTITGIQGETPGKTAIRVINATDVAIDVRVYRQVGGVVTSPIHTWLALPAYTVSTYATLDTASYMYNVRAAGAAGNMVAADARTIPGAQASCSNVACVGAQPKDIPAEPGTTVGGSAVTGIVFPRSTAGSRAPQATAFTAPSISFMWDRRPPRGCLPKYC
jgi:uncharacterized protein (UPF0333 family)